VLETLPRQEGLPSRHDRPPRPPDHHAGGPPNEVLTYRGVNALMECVIGLFKTECIRTTVFHDGPYKTIADVEYATAGWVDWYNNRAPAQHSWE